MTAIEYGGGATVEQRKEFCNLLPGSHVPGYMGNIPLYKYSHGNTFGRQTALISARLPYYNGPVTSEKVIVNPRIGSGKISATPKVFKDEIPRDRIPLSNADNRYTEGMIPGYSGHLPKMALKYGSTFSHLADDCINEFVTNYNTHEDDQKKLCVQSGLFPKLKPISDDPRVRNHLNLWVDDYLNNSDSRCKPKGPTDPPTTGYAGHIPKAIASNLSFGCTYQEGVKKSLSVFRAECTNHFGRLKLPVEPLKPENDRFIPQVVDMDEKPNSFRLYRNNGIIANYAGHVHGQNFTSGRTQGDITRNLDVCSHHYPSYGLYLRNKDLAKDGCR